MVKVGIIGLGGMGRTHWGCYANSGGAQVVAVCSRDERKLRGDWPALALNIGASQQEHVDLSGVAPYRHWTELIADANVDLVDVCLPTPWHAEVSIAALRAGKHVLCEKPMAMNAEECRAMQRAAQESGRQLMIGHCLRYWPHYVRAHELLQSGEVGRVLQARFHRFSPAPQWSAGNWLMAGAQSGGAVLDMHIHDVDAALWWFGAPAQIQAHGVISGDLPLAVDAVWRYEKEKANDGESGPLVVLHGSWDNNGGEFSYGFKVMGEKGTLLHEPSGGAPGLHLLRPGHEPQTLEVSAASAHQSQIDDFINCIATDRTLSRVTPHESRLAVEVALEELRQVRAAA